MEAPVFSNVDIRVLKRQLTVFGILTLTYSLKYFHTASSQVTNFPDYVGVGYLDDIQIGYYDSNTKKAEAKQEWMNNFTTVHQEHFTWQTQLGIRNEVNDKDTLERLQKSFNHTEGLHIYQRMYGCEWNDETDEIKSWEQSSYDGEDFLALDTKTWTWTAAKSQAVPMKHKLDHDRNHIEYLKLYYTGICVDNLKKYVNFGKDVLMRTELPEVFLLQKTPSSPVSCFATGFYPSSAALFWRKDGKDLQENVVHGEMLPNPDGTFQMTVDLKLEVTAEVESKYECVFQLSGVKEDLVTKLERRSILNNASDEGEKDTHSSIHFVPLDPLWVTGSAGDYLSCIRHIKLNYYVLKSRTLAIFYQNFHHY
ncbi:class I histocompatibility antigen, Non-RT1.A alpha-1 chain-like [Nerophis lumbriciformis]|uniref:class I histocompatibility antigen, Non-RT1.A alpha-1 chain-like n=1 Tax=Nerophis lumbriciformis TaxID=546530 RepID=UPI002AE08E7B|nr:class I histocompatibility antigen, Non-RT1.A alpha-1 chain-like [Nerophis lumbriciformis]